MSVRENIRFNGQREMERSRVFSELPKVDLNNLMQKVKEEEKKKKKKQLSGFCSSSFGRGCIRDNYNSVRFLTM